MTDSEIREDGAGGKRYSLDNPPPLEPCPFCGGPAKLYEVHGEGYSTYGRFWYSVGCVPCDAIIIDREEWDANFHLVHPPMECVERWNARAKS